MRCKICGEYTRENPATDWFNIGLKLIENIEKRGGIWKASEAIKWINENFELPPEYQTEAWGKYQVMQNIKKALEGKVSSIPFSVRTHPITGEVSPTFGEGWFIIKSVPLQMEQDILKKIEQLERELKILKSQI